MSSVLLKSVLVGLMLCSATSWPVEFKMRTVTTLRFWSVAFTVSAPCVGLGYRFVPPLTVVGSTAVAKLTVKLVLLVATSPGVVTTMGPALTGVVAATVAEICVALTTVNCEAAVPLMVTAVAPVKLVPVMVTIWLPRGPLVGVKLVIAGDTVKLVAEVAVPPGVVTAMVPVVAPVGTVVVMLVALTTVNVGCAVPLKFTAVVPLKLVPVSVTAVAMGPLVGLKLVRVGAGITVKLLAEVAVPPGVVTAMVPVVAPAGTVVVMLVALATV
jgi:hypothetical protein